MAAYLLQIFAVYNNHSATPVTYKARKVLSHKAFRASLTLAALGYITAADAQQLRGLQLGQGRLPRQAVPQQYELPLPPGQPLDEGAQPRRLVLFLARVLHAGGVLQQVGQRQGRIFLAGVQRLLQRDGGPGFFVPPQLHADLIFNAPAGIGGKSGPAGAVEGVDRLDQPDGADADEVVLVAGQGVVFFGDVGHQPQVVADDLLPRGGVAGAQRLEGVGLLPRGQRPREAARLQMQRKIEKLRRKELQQRQKHTQSPLSLSVAPVYVRQADFMGGPRRNCAAAPHRV